jgi:hypothetical protein
MEWKKTFAGQISDKGLESRMYKELLQLNNRKIKYPIKKGAKKLGMMAHTCNPSTWETETGRFQIQVHPGLPSETLSKKKKKKIYRWPISI